LILFGVQDVGPARWLLPVLKLIDKEFSLVASETVLSACPELLEFAISESNVNWGAVTLCATGTSLGDPKTSLEKRLWSQAKSLSIPTAAWIEHWTWYLARFDTGNGILMPDYVLVNDTAARDQLSSAIPFLKAEIVVLGNPALEERVLAAPANLTSRTEKNNRVAFISENHSAFPKISLALGFDEFVALSLLQSALPSKFGIDILLHPSEDRGKYSRFLEAKRLRVLENNDFYNVVATYRLIVGMTSMFLVESSLFRDDVLSLIPNPSFPFSPNSSGFTNLITDASHFEDFLRRGPESNRRNPDWILGSSERIALWLSKIGGR